MRQKVDGAFTKILIDFYAWVLKASSGGKGVSRVFHFLDFFADHLYN